LVVDWSAIAFFGASGFIAKQRRRKNSLLRGPSQNITPPLTLESPKPVCIENTRTRQSFGRLRSSKTYSDRVTVSDDEKHPTAPITCGFDDPATWGVATTIVWNVSAMKVGEHNINFVPSRKQKQSYICAHISSARANCSCSLDRKKTESDTRARDNCCRNGDCFRTTRKSALIDKCISFDFFFR
jgi:hypothetical protein